MTTPEAKARQAIDLRLSQAGWLVQDHKQVNLGAGLGVAVREYPTATGPADYVLFVDRQAVGVIEAKKDDTILTFNEDQTLRYSLSALKWQVGAGPLPFLYESTGKITRFYDLRTNMHFTLKTKPLKSGDLEDFVRCYNPDNRHERKASERFKYFSYEELMARDKASLDVFWLKDDSLDNLDDLPSPEVLQQEIIDHLEAALNAFRDVAAGLATRPAGG